MLERTKHVKSRENAKGASWPLFGRVEGYLPALCRFRYKPDSMRGSLGRGRNPRSAIWRSRISSRVITSGRSFGSRGGASLLASRFILFPFIIQVFVFGSASPNRGVSKLITEGFDKGQFVFVRCPDTDKKLRRFGAVDDEPMVWIGIDQSDQSLRAYILALYKKALAIAVGDSHSPERLANEGGVKLGEDRLIKSNRHFDRDISSSLERDQAFALLLNLQHVLLPHVEGLLPDRSHSFYKLKARFGFAQFILLHQLHVQGAKFATIGHNQLVRPKHTKGARALTPTGDQDREPGIFRLQAAGKAVCRISRPALGGQNKQSIRAATAGTNGIREWLLPLWPKWTAIGEYIRVGLSCDPIGGFAHWVFLRLALHSAPRFHRAAAACLAISLRRSEERFFALAAPPFGPPRLPSADITRRMSSGVGSGGVLVAMEGVSHA